MLTSLALVAAIAGPAQAEEVNQSIVANPFALTWPALDARYEKKLDKKQGAYGTVIGGKYNPLVFRVLSALASTAGDEISLGGTVFGVGGGYNYYFKSFKRGWYVNGDLEFNRVAMTITSGNESLSLTTSTLVVGPRLGYKKVGDSGFTFQWDIGAGYTAVIGDPKVEYTGANGSLTDTADTQTAGGLGLTGGFNLGYSF